MKKKLEILMNSNDVENTVLACEIYKGIAIKGNRTGIIAHLYTKLLECQEFVELIPDRMADLKLAFLDKCLVLNDTIQHIDRMEPQN
jgi:hypothetical protein